MFVICMMKNTIEKIENGKRELLKAREELNTTGQFHLAGELSAVVIVLDELKRCLEIEVTYLPPEVS